MEVTVLAYFQHASVVNVLQWLIPDILNPGDFLAAES